MAKERSLLPAETIRLATLGFLAEGPLRYGALAAQLRDFIGLAVGPSLDLMGSSIELLRYEGLVAADDGTGMSDNATLALTQAGHAALTGLIEAPLSTSRNDAGRLALLLKLRFLHHLPAADQATQRRLIADALDAELTRLDELHRRFGTAAPAFADWLDRDRANLARRIADLRRPG